MAITRKIVGGPKGARVEISIFVALLLVILTTGDTILTWLVAHIAPGLLPRIEAMAPVVRLMLFGGVPAAIVAIWGLVATRGRPAKHR